MNNTEEAVTKSEAPGAIRFEDGAAYDRFMGVWSRLVGQIFLDWLAPDSGWRWLDVGCGNGAFTELIVRHCAPQAVDGIDPAPAQLAYARTIPALQGAQFRQGDAMALPFADNAFDAAVMPLVIFFVPDPAKGVAEMARVVRPGGVVAAYAWDMVSGGFPYQDLRLAMNELGVSVPMPPSPDASLIENMKKLWSDAGVQSVETREIAVQRIFSDFDDYWATVLGGPSAGSKLAAMKFEDQLRLQSFIRERQTKDANGRIVYNARANAVKGHVPT